MKKFLTRFFKSMFETKNVDNDYTNHLFNKYSQASIAKLSCMG